MNQLSKNIKKLRLENGMTQEELARKLNVTFQTVSKWETGVNYPDVLCIPEIAEAFDVSIDELYKGDLSSYKNKAEKLLSKYESDITDDTVYKKALEEFKILELSNDLDNIDMTNYGYLHYLRAVYHLHTAKKWYSTYLKNEKIVLMNIIKKPVN